MQAKVLQKAVLYLWCILYILSSFDNNCDAVK